MTRELQDLAWSVLPKEFKKEVNEIYFNAVVYHPCGYNHKTDLLKYLFGRHNLTSNAVEEEVLYVSRKKLQYFYEKLRAVGENHAAFALQSLFGSKCLMDKLNEDNFVKSEPKPAEPKNEGTRQEQYAPKKND